MGGDVRPSESTSGDTEHARRGLSWTVGSLLVLAASQVAYTSATARLVSPSEFGYYASAQALAAIAGYLSLASLGSAVMRHPVGHGLRRASLSLAGTSGVAAGAAVALVGGWWAHLWGISGAADAARLAGLCVALSPVMAVMTGLQRRALRFRWAATAELLGNVAGFGAGLVLALAWHNALALLLGQAACSLVIVLFCLPGSRPSGPDGARVKWRDLAGFATNVSAQNLVYYVIYGLPAFSISRTMGAAALGVYNRANVLVNLPLTQLAQSVSRVLYPLWARRTDPESVRGPFTDVLVGASLIGTLGFGALIGAAAPITRLLFGSEFSGVDGLVRILAVFGILNLQFSISGSLQEASRWMRDVWQLQLIKLAVSALLLLMPLIENAEYAAAVLVLGQVVAHARQLRQLQVRNVLRLRPVLIGYGQHALLVAPPALALWGATLLLDGLAAQLVATAVAVAVTLTALGLLGDRVAGIRALDRRGLLPAAVGARLRRQHG